MDGVGKIVEGVNALEAALNSNRVKKVIVLDTKHNKSNKFNFLIEGIKKQNIEIECSLKWNATYSEDIYSFTNNIFQKDGGTHLLGFRSSLTRVINKYANEQNLLKKNKEQCFRLLRIEVN